ncbi:hypothetical protein CBL_13959 [Carabus blaptoides fortunei]
MNYHRRWNGVGVSSVSKQRELGSVIQPSDCKPILQLTIRKPASLLILQRGGSRTSWPVLSAADWLEYVDDYDEKGRRHGWIPSRHRVTTTSHHTCDEEPMIR